MHHEACDHHRGHVEGSIIMGMEQALFEEMVVKGEGIINTNLHEYRIPTMMDIPEIETEIVDSYDPESPYGAKECGEGPIQPVIPAILNALYDAIGVRFTELPVTPEKALAALHAQKRATLDETNFECGLENSEGGITLSLAHSPREFRMRLATPACYQHVCQILFWSYLFRQNGS